MKEMVELKKMSACREALLWLEIQSDWDTAWQNCKRGDWMLWLLGKLSSDPETESRKTLVLCVCECVRLVLPYVPEGEKRPRIAVETAEAWARGEATIEQVRAAAAAAAAAADYVSAPSYAAVYAAVAASAAASAASAAVYAAAADYASAAVYAAAADYASATSYAAAAAASAASYAAASAAYASATSYTAAAAASAASYAAASASYVADYVAGAKFLVQCAALVRNHYPKAPKLQVRRYSKSRRLRECRRWTAYNIPTLAP